MDNEQLKKPITLTLENGVFICRCPKALEDLPLEAGFIETGKKEIVYYTRLPHVAARLVEFSANTNTQRAIKTTALLRSSWAEPLLDPPGGQSFLDFQPGAIKFVLERNRSYLALSPGLGKTVVAATVCRELFLKHKSAFKAVYVCPPFLVTNTLNEFNKWCPEANTQIVNAKSPWKNHSAMTDILVEADIVIIPDSIIARPIVKFFVALFASLVADNMLIVDEAHRFKESKTQRTKAILGQGVGKPYTRFGLKLYFEKVCYMSGTPMPNRPMEIYTTVAKNAHECIDYVNKHAFGVRYCGAYYGTMGWDYSGESNKSELAERVQHPTGPFMYKLNKDVLDLPPKMESTIFVSGTMSRQLAALDNKIRNIANPEGGIDMESYLIDKLKRPDSQLHVATYRRLLAIEKVPHTVAIVSEILENEPQTKLLLFGVHREAMQALADGLQQFNPHLIMGGVSTKARNAAVDDIQSANGKSRLVVANIGAAGVGLTLTGAHRVVFHEPSWVPAENDQASDRAHRHGQTKTVLVQYVLFQNSIDATIIMSNLKKREATKLFN